MRASKVREKSFSRDHSDAEGEEQAEQVDMWQSWELCYVSMDNDNKCRQLPACLIEGGEGCTSGLFAMEQ